MKSEVGYIYWILEGHGKYKCFVLCDSWEEAIEQAKTLAGIKGQARLKLLPPRLSLFEALQKAMGVNADSAQTMAAVGLLLSDPHAKSVLEQLSQFLSPLRLPHKLYLVTIECGENPSPHYDPGSWAIFLCYEFSEILDKVAPKPGKPAQGFTHDEVVVGSYAGVVLHEAGHAVFDSPSVA